MVVNHVASDLHPAAAGELSGDLEAVSVGGLEFYGSAGQFEGGQTAGYTVQRDYHVVFGADPALARGQRPASVYLDRVVVGHGAGHVAGQDNLAAGKFQKRTVAVGIRGVRADQTAGLDLERRAGADVGRRAHKDQVACALLDDRRAKTAEVDARRETDV